MVTFVWDDAIEEIGSYLLYNNYLFMYTEELAHRGLVAPYGDIDRGKHSLRPWLIAWRYQAITWTSVATN